MPLKILIPIILAIAPILVTLTYGGSEYILMVGSMMLVYIVAVSGLDIVFGYCGQISLGHAAFYAIGAYGSAMMHNLLGDCPCCLRWYLLRLSRQL